MTTEEDFDLKYYHRAKSAQLIRGGIQFFEMLEKLIRKAEFEIHFQFYILEEDETGIKIIDALIEAAKSGVDVYVVLDAYGSSKLNDQVLEDFELAGVQFKWFRPVISLKNMELGRRLHHKVVSIDEKIALTTGVNIANRYNDINGIPAWLDFALLIEGDTALEIKRRCLQIWEKTLDLKKRWRKFRIPQVKKSIRTQNPLVKVSVNDWLRGRNDIYVGYKHAINVAQEEIFIAGGYFLPGRVMRKTLKDARLRNVSVSVVLTKISDVSFAKEASEYLYSWMLKKGIRIYEWEPNVMHGKIAVVDKLWSTIGSFNLNYLSAFESIELNMEIIDGHFSNQVSELLKTIAHSECSEVNEADFIKKLSIRKRMKNWISYVFVRYSFRILNLFSKKPKFQENGQN
jgi:cardiolipin synthase